MSSTTTTSTMSMIAPLMSTLIVDPATSYAAAPWVAEQVTAYVGGFRGTSLPIEGRRPSVVGAEAHKRPELGTIIDRRRGACVVANRVAVGGTFVRHLPSVPGRGEHMN